MAYARGKGNTRNIFIFGPPGENRHNLLAMQKESELLRDCYLTYNEK